MVSYIEEYRSWLDSPALSNREWQELDAISDNEKEIKDRFFAPLEFGTAGLRGIMGMGVNRMNLHVIRHVTQAFAMVINEEEGEKSVVVCYDCRVNSREYAREVAMVMSGNGIHVRIFDDLRPTPELSFAIRHFGATAGINVTASHNPKEYNGYKVYWSDGAQLPPNHATAISRVREEIDIFTSIRKMEFEDAEAAGLVEFIGAEVDEAFMSNVMAQAINPSVVSKVADDLKIVYTPFHGAGHKLVPDALARLGVTRLFPVPEQMVIDGEFPTVESPNPEEPEGFALAVELAKKVGADLIIGTDPDADRVGVMIRASDGSFVPISGNKTGVLLLDYVINARRESGTLPKNAAAIKTIVTTEMAAKVARENDVHTTDTFTGFKFIAEKLAEFEQTAEYEYIFGYEESYGYMIGSFVRDKDAVTASMLIAEMAAYYLDQGMNLGKALDGLYKKYGYYGESTVNLTMPGLDGLEKMKSLMAGLREAPPTEIADIGVARVRDYMTGEISVKGVGVVEKTEIFGSNVLYYELENGTSFIIRPSGTEPKIKVYILTRGTNMEECDEKIVNLSAYAKALQ